MKPTIPIAMLVGSMIVGFIVSAEVSDEYLCTLKNVDCHTTIKATVYAYTSRSQETDSTPTITASGSTVRRGVIANNCLSFGTRVRLNGQEYTVEDRMHKRYGCEVFDIWYESLEDARNWGRRTVEVEIVD